MKRFAPVFAAMLVLVSIAATGLAQPPGRGGMGVDAEAFKTPPLPVDDQEKKILAAMEEQLSLIHI